MLPPHWELKNLEELADSIQYGYTESASEAPVGPKFLRITDIQHGCVEWKNVPYCLCSADELEKFRLYTGDIVFARTGATTGKSYLLTDCPEAVFASYLIRLRFKPHVNRKFIALFFLSPQYWQQIMKERKGSAQPGVNATVLSKLQIPLPTEEEQMKIVERVDELISELDSGVSSLKRVQANLKRYKASVLKAACEGRLVPTEAELARQEGRDYESGADLLQRILAERREKWAAEQRARGKDPRKMKYEEPKSPQVEGLPELPEGWVWATVEQVADHRLGKMLDKQKNRGELRPYLRNANVRWFSFDLSDVQYMRVEEDGLDEVTARSGDLIVCEGGEPGRAAVWERPEMIVIQKALHRIRLPKAIQPWYLAYFIAKSASSGTLERYFTGSTIKHFTGESIRSFVFALPPFEEQTRIVKEVDKTLSIINKYETQVTKCILRSEHLRQSILKQAFEGRLVPLKIENFSC